MSVNSVVQNLKLSQIRTDGGTQPRTELNESTVADYAEAIAEGAKFPPVTVFHDGSDYWLADGFHRLFAHRKIGALDIEAAIHQGTKRDAVLHSFGANDKHGLRRSNADKWNAVLRLLDDVEWAKWSDNKVAQTCCVSVPFVGTVRRSLLTVNSEEPKERTYTTKYGTEAVMKTSNIGKVAQPKVPSDPAKEARKFSERPADIPAQDHADELNEARYTITELSEQLEETQDRIAVLAMDGTDEEKYQAQETIRSLRNENKELHAKLDAAESMRDQYMTESAEKTKQILYWRKKAERVAA